MWKVPLCIAKGIFYNKKIKLKSHDFLSELSVDLMCMNFLFIKILWIFSYMFILPSSHARCWAYHFFSWKLYNARWYFRHIVVFFFSSLYSNIKFFANVQSTKFYLNIFLNVNIILFYLGVTEHESFRYLNFSFFFYIKSSWPKNLSKFLSLYNSNGFSL